MKNLIEKSKSVSMNLRFSGLETRLTPLVEINLYRIINELVNNTMKHSQADTININISRDKKGVRIFFSYNGKLFSPDAIYTGIVLYNIKNRMNHFKGQYNIETVKDSGT